MKNSENRPGYILTPEQEKELDRMCDNHTKGVVKYIPAKKSLKNIRQKLKTIYK
ncbi:MAG: hypothetical protein M3R17_18455 [Bacteroidota bacterium]|nr:hypothetical protein [Bacteroidota bacterium]